MDSCLINVFLCLFKYIGVQQNWVVFLFSFFLVLFTQYYQFLWIVYSWLYLPFSLMFIYPFWYLQNFLKQLVMFNNSINQYQPNEESLLTSYHWEQKDNNIGRLKSWLVTPTNTWHLLFNVLVSLIYCSLKSTERSRSWVTTNLKSVQIYTVSTVVFWPDIDIYILKEKPCSYEIHKFQN